MKRSYFTDAEVALIERLWADGLPVSVIAECTSRQRGVISRLMSRDRDRFPKRGPRAGRTLSEETIASAAAMWAEGMKAEEIGKRLGMSRESVVSMAARHRRRFPKRNLAPGNKTSDATIEAAAAMWADGVRVEDMAKRLGLTRNSVNKIVNRNRSRFPRREAALCHSARVRGKAQIAAFTAERYTRSEPLPVPDDASRMSFQRAVDEYRCLFACSDVDDSCGPDMQVCGAPRADDGGNFTRYCAFHAQLSIGPGTPGERNAHRTLIWAAGAAALRVTS